MCNSYRSVTMSAYAKINTYLEVTAKRPDGYHELCSHMQLISLSDTLRVTVYPGEPFAMTLCCDCPHIPLGEDNLILRAAVALLERYPLQTPARIVFELEKRIPMQGGLAGGSTDAAAALLALCQLLDLPVTQAELLEIATGIGADVPFCIQGRRGPQAARGIGEILCDAPGLPEELTLVLVSPGTAVSTPQAFRALDAQMDYAALQGQEQRFEQMLCALRSGKLCDIAQASFNRFEQIIFPMQPSAADVFDTMHSLGAGAVRMSGSGPTIVGYFEDADAAKRCAARFENMGYAAYLASPITHAVD